MPQQGASDANFFALVHHVLEASRLDDQQAGANRRDDRRHIYNCLQFVAPYHEGKLPAREEFQRVLCYDLSPNGFSYLADRLPESEYLIAALGQAPYILLSAAVVRQSRIDYEGKWMHLVGCRFITRIKDATLA